MSQVVNSWISLFSGSYNVVFMGHFLPVVGPLLEQLAKEMYFLIAGTINERAEKYPDSLSSLKLARVVI